MKPVNITKGKSNVCRATGVVMTSLALGLGTAAATPATSIVYR